MPFERKVFGVPADGKVDVTVDQPVDLIRRDLEIRNIRLGDYVARDTASMR
jgi:SPX domain protein involved in polyphosphate accumulation